MQENYFLISVSVQLLTIIGIIFAVGKFAGKNSAELTSISGTMNEIKVELKDHRTDLREHADQDYSNFKDIASEINNIKVLLASTGKKSTH